MSTTEDMLFEGTYTLNSNIKFFRDQTESENHNIAIDSLKNEFTSSELKDIYYALKSGHYSEELIQKVSDMEIRKLKEECEKK